MSVIVVGLVAAVLALGGLATGTSQLLHLSQRLQSAADLASLAASDVSLGVVPGLPCGMARSILAHYPHYRLSCAMEHSMATVTIRTEWWGVTLSRTSRAGPDPTLPWRDEEHTP